MKRTYHLLFTACRDHAVTHPTAIAMGLGFREEPPPHCPLPPPQPHHITSPNPSIGRRFSARETITHPALFFSPPRIFPPLSGWPPGVPRTPDSPLSPIPPLHRLFLPPIEGEAVKALYHEAQFELLAEGSYGFDTYFLNPGPGRAAALRLLDTQNYSFQVSDRRRHTVPPRAAPNVGGYNRHRAKRRENSITNAGIALICAPSTLNSLVFPWAVFCFFLLFFLLLEIG